RLFSDRHLRFPTPSRPSLRLTTDEAARISSFLRRLPRTSKPQLENAGVRCSRSLFFKLTPNSTPPSTWQEYPAPRRKTPSSIGARRKLWLALATPEARSQTQHSQ